MTAPRVSCTADEYLAFERTSKIRHQFIDGEVFATSGGSDLHNYVAGNVCVSLRTQMRGRECRAYASDGRVCVSRTGMFTYPDVVALCGEAQFLDGSVDTLLNPSVIVEVLSPSREVYDRGTKFTHDQKIASLRQYVLISQKSMFVEVFTREIDRWFYLSLSRPSDVLKFPALDCEMLLSAVYEQVRFDESDAVRSNPAPSGSAGAADELG